MLVHVNTAISSMRFPASEFSHSLTYFETLAAEKLHRLYEQKQTAPKEPLRLMSISPAGKDGRQRDATDGKTRRHNLRQFHR